MGKPVVEFPVREHEPITQDLLEQAVFRPFRYSLEKANEILDRVNAGERSEAAADINELRQFVKAADFPRKPVAKSGLHLVAARKA
jgi:hypothetical protein